MPYLTDLIKRTHNVLTSPIAKGMVLTATMLALINEVSGECNTCDLMAEQAKEVGMLCQDIVLNCLLQNFAGSSAEFSSVYNSQFPNEYYECYSRTMATRPELQELRNSLGSKLGNLAAGMTSIFLFGKFSDPDAAVSEYTCPQL